MEPLTAGLLGSAIGNIGGGLLGSLFSGDDRDAAMADINEAIKIIDQLPIPDVDKRIIFEQFQESGSLSPQVLQKTIEEHVPPKVLQEQQQNKLRQEAAMRELEQMSKTGMGAQERLALEQSRRQAAQDSQAKLATIQQQMQAQGMGGSGAQIAAMLGSGQAADDRQAMEALQIAAQAGNRRKDAIKDMFSAAGQMRSADLDVDKYNVGTENEANRFAAQNAINRSIQNANFANQANVMNLQRSQQVSDANVGQENKERLRLGHDAKLAMADAAYRKAGMKAGALQSRANVHAGNAASTAQNWANIGSAGGSLLGMGMAGGFGGGSSNEFGNTGNGTYRPGGALMMSRGGKIEGPEVVEGDDHANDIVPALLSPGEVVVPKTKAKDPKKAAEFVAEVNGQSLEKKKDSRKKVMNNLSELLKSLSELEE